MKLFLLSLLLLAAPPQVSQVFAGPGGCEGGKDSRVFVVQGEKAAPSVVCRGCGTAPQQVAVTASAGSACCAGTSDGRSEPKVVRIEKQETGEGRGWLGVSIASVPGSLASQLKLEGRGVLVVNVVEGSPADRVGLKPHDIILKIDGTAVESEVGPAVDLIKSRKPNDEVTIVVLRDGVEKTMPVKLGSRDELAPTGFTWKFEGEDAPDVDVEESVRTRGKILMPGPGGEWVMKDLGDLEQLKELPKHIQAYIPKSGSRSVQIHVDGDKKKVKTVVQHGGGTVVIAQEGDGPITVTRADKTGKEETETYASKDELRKGDEEAYDLWENVTDSATIHLDLDGIEIPDIELPDITVDIDADEWQEHAEGWRTQLEKSLTEAQEAYERAMEQFHQAMEQWKSQKASPDYAKAPSLPEFFSGKKGAPDVPWMMLGEQFGAKPRHTFELRADGKIEVRIRKGDSELVRVYDNQADMERRDPQLFKKYEKLMSADSE